MKTLLPDNATRHERALELAVRPIFETEPVIDRLWNAQTCPIELLPFLAWALSVDVWSEDWPEQRKRYVVAGAVRVHRQKGTIGAMRTALDLLDLGISVSEWFEHDGPRFSFRIDVQRGELGLTRQELNWIKATLKRTKNARSWLERLRVYLAAPASHNIAGSLKIIRRIKGGPRVLPITDTVTGPTVVASLSVRRTLKMEVAA